jgi:phosphoglucosamine mutase
MTDRRLFGTDGIRGVAGEHPLDPATVYAFGRALGRWVARHGSLPGVVIGVDTRESGPWLARCVAAGLAREGAAAHFAGVITTPGIAYLTRTGPFAAGVMISASHNPYEDNGLKVFDHSGYKLPDAEEHRLEAVIFGLAGSEAAPAGGEAPAEPELDESYLDYLASLGTPLNGVHIAVDCGHGAAFRLGPALFERLGARVTAVGREPDGTNINRDCGALHPDRVRRETLAVGAGVGVAFDGDADRAIFVSRSGRIVDGDGVMLVCGRALKAEGRLTGDDGWPLVVATVMSNLGLERALAAGGIRMLRTPVGDKYVLEEMLRRNAALGGEQSGHVIFRDCATTGDGLLTALRLFGVMRATGADLDDLLAGMEIFPQILVNVRVREKRPLAELSRVQQLIGEAEAAFGDAGRILVRFSGTEPLARVMIEGADAAMVEFHSRRIADALRAELGG